MIRHVAAAALFVSLSAGTPCRAQSVEPVTPVDPGAAAFGAAVGGLLGGVAGAALERRLHRGEGLTPAGGAAGGRKRPDLGEAGRKGTALGGSDPGKHAPGGRPGAGHGGRRKAPEG